MSEPLNVLILEDVPADAELIIYELRKFGDKPDCQVVDNKKDYLHYLKPTLDIILSDFSLPQFTGLEALRLRNESGYNIPFIIVSGEIGEDLAVECMREGAQDYLFKDRMGRLGQAIRQALEKKSLRDEKRQSDQILQESEQFQKTIFETTVMPTGIIEEDTTISMVNRAFEDLSGYSKEEIEGKKRWTEFVGADDLKRMKEYHQQRRNDPDSVLTEYEFQFINREGVIRNILLNVNTIPGTKRSVASFLDFTERKQAEESLLENQKRYKKAQAMGHAGNWEYDPETTNFWASDESKRIYGFRLDSESFTAEKVESCIPERERVHQALIDLIEHDKTYDLVFDINTFDKGIQKTIHSLAEVKRDTQGKAVKITGVISDVTEQKRGEQALRESETKHRTYIEHAPLGIFIVDGKGRYIGVNPGACKLLGYPRDELLKLSIPDIAVRKEDAESLGRLKKEKIVSFESQLKKKDGSVVDVRVDAVSIPGDQFIAFCTDITESKEFTHKIQRERDKAQNYLDIAGVIILVLNENAEISHINQKGCQILGYQENELKGLNWFDTCLPERYRKEVKGVFKGIVAGGDEMVEFFENPILTKSGEERTIAWHNTVLWDEKGHNIGALSSGEDITERIHSEEEIKSLSKFTDENPNPILRFSKEGKILYASNSSAALLKKWGRSIGESVTSDWKKKISTSFTSNEIHEVEEVCENRSISLILAPIKEMDYVNAYGRDVTERVRSEHLLKALNQASVAMGAALSQQGIFNAVAKELKQLDISCMLFPLDETGTKLITAYIGYEPAIIMPLEKLAGITFKKHSFSIDTVDIFQRVIWEKETIFEDTSEQTVKQIYHNQSKKTITSILNIFQDKKVISMPLIIEDKVIGTFMVQSTTLTQRDIPATIAFAHQLAGAWNKAQLVQDLRKTVEGTIHTIAATVEARDPYTAGHQMRVTDLITAIASEMGLDSDRVEGIKMAGIIHDLGKISIPAEILSKPGKLSDLEFKLIKTHPQNGFDLLKEIEFPWPIAQIILQHHEKMDGSGYPQGLKGEEIMLEARILAVADIVEAMSSHRPYRSALGIDKALEQIKQDKGTLLDPDAVDACLKVFEQGYKLPAG